MKMPPKYSLYALLVHLHLFFLVNAQANAFDYTRDGCYSGLEGFTSMGQSASMSSMYCMNLCSKKGYTVAAVTSPGVCYCGNAIPATQIDPSKCSFPCPAYPAENCGGEDGAYNVFHTGDDVTTAAAAPSTSSADTNSDTASASPSTASGSAPPTTSTTSTGTSEKTTSPSNTEASNSAGGTSSTQSGKVTTATATVTDSVTHSVTALVSSSATSTPGTAADAAANKKSGGGLSGGAIAGIVVGVVCGVGVVAGIVAFVLIRRQRDDFYSPQSSPTKFNDSAGFHGGYNASYPVVDQRLNPDLLGGDHRISIASLVDARDYSRQILKVVNPDDEKY